MKYLAKLLRSIVQRIRNISSTRLVFILSIVIGITSGLAAVVIKYSVYFIQSFLHSNTSIELKNYLYFIYPAIGLLITVLFIKYIVKHNVSHGIPGVLYSISESDGIIKKHNMFSSIVTSAFTVGFGGSVGLEGPTVATGGAIGSFIGRFFHLSYKQIILLLGCACSGAMAAIFKAPIAAVVFAIEVIMLDLTMSSIIPLLISSVTGALISYMFLGQVTLYHFELKQSFILSDLPYYILIGIIAGFVSVYFTRVYMFINGIFEKMPKPYIRLIIGSISLGILIFLLPALYGEGYECINSCLNGDYKYLFNNSLYYDFKDSFIAAIVLMLVVIVFKVVATSITFGSGGIGGIFAPTLFMGANTGLLFSLIINRLGFKELTTSNFALVGMAGLIAGVLHAPLTAIFLIADITSGYKLFLPLMITATIAYATVRLFEKNSVYTIQLASRRQLITHHKDKAVLRLLKIEKLIETNFSILAPNNKLRDVIDAVSKSKRNVFPVLKSDGTLVGILTLNDIRNIMFKPHLYDSIYVKDIMYYPEVSVSIDETMEDIAKVIHSSEHFNFPVLNKGKYMGFVSRANVYSAYRSMLKEFSED